MNAEVRTFADTRALARAAAALVAERAEAAVRARGRFLLVLAGGRTPLALYERLAGPEVSASLPWGRTHVFWGDERCVPLDNPESNAGAAQRVLLSRVGVRAENVHPAPVGAGTPERVAARWEAELRAFFGGATPFPVFDLLLQGIGADGHTASLFPGDPAVGERERWTAAVDTPAAVPPVPRVTLTLPVLNGGRCVVFLAGREKAPVVQAILADPGRAAARYPAALVRPAGELHWYVEAGPDAPA